MTSRPAPSYRVLKKSAKARKSVRRQWGTTLPQPSKRPKKANAARKLREFARTFGSGARVLFVRALPCAACGVVGYSENAHLLGVEGARRKGHYTTVGPLCGDHSQTMGCHREYDEYRWSFVVRFPDFDAAVVASRTQALWAANEEAGK